MSYKRLIFVVLVSLALSSSTWATTVFSDEFTVAGRVDPGWNPADPAVLPADASTPAKVLAATGNTGDPNTGIADAWDGASGDSFTTAPATGIIGNEGKVTVEVDAIFAGDLTEINFGSSSPVGIWGDGSIRLGMRKDGGAPSIWWYTSNGPDPDADYNSPQGLFGITDDNWHRIKVEFDGFGDDTLKVWVDGILYLDQDLATYEGGAANNRIMLDYVQLYMNNAGSEGYWDNLVITAETACDVGIVVPLAPITPDPVDDAPDISVDTSLNWVGDPNACSYDVYLGLASGSVFLVDTVPTASYDPPASLNTNAEYFWRIDATNPVGTTTGTEWSFTTVPPVPPVPTNGVVVFSDDFDVSAGPRANPGWHYNDSVQPPVIWDPAVLPADSSDPAKLAAATGNSGAANGVADPYLNRSGVDWLINPPGSGIVGNEGILTLEFDAIMTSGDHFEILLGSGDPPGMWSGDSLRFIFRREDAAYTNGLNLYSSLGASDDFDHVVAKPFTGISDDNWHNFKFEFDGIGDDVISLSIDGALKGSLDLATLVDNQGADGGTGALNNRISLDQISFGNNWAPSAFIDNVVISVAEACKFALAAPLAPITPDPVDDATGISIFTSLSWAGDPNVCSYDVYLGLASGSLFLVDTVSTASYVPPASLNIDTEYFWRIDATNPVGTTTGTEWSFTTVPPTCGQDGQVYNPMDFDTNCTVDLADIAAFVSQWLKCTDPADQVNCDSWNGL